MSVYDASKIRIMEKDTEAQPSSYHARNLDT